MHPGVILLTLIIVGLLLVSWLKRSPGGQLPPAARIALLVVGGAVVLILMTRVHVGFGLLAALPLLQRLLAQARAMRSAAGPSPGQTSQVTTDFLEMSIDHDTGVMSGSVLRGEFRGRTVEDLTLDELLALLDECRREDPQGASILESFLDRNFAEGWERPGDSERRQTEDGGAGSADGAMTRAQAYEVLGLEEGATEQNIVEAHRRLMQKLHPDRGGSSFLAAQINRAKDTLLGA